MEKEEAAQGKGPEGMRARPGDSLGPGHGPLSLPMEQQAGQEATSSCGSEQRFLEVKECSGVVQGKRRPSGARPWLTAAAWGSAGVIPLQVNLR